MWPRLQARGLGLGLQFGKLLSSSRHTWWKGTVVDGELFVSAIHAVEQMLSEGSQEAGVTQERPLMSPRRWDTQGGLPRGDSSRMTQHRDKHRQGMDRRRCHDSPWKLLGEALLSYNVREKETGHRNPGREPIVVDPWL